MIQLYKYTVEDGLDSVNLNSSSPLTVHEGDDVAVSCEANCNPPCSYSWKLKSPIIPASRVLTLNNTRRSSAGVYTSSVINRATQKSLDKQIRVDVQCELNMLASHDKPNTTNTATTATTTNTTTTTTITATTTTTTTIITTTTTNTTTTTTTATTLLLLIIIILLLPLLPQLPLLQLLLLLLQQLLLLLLQLLLLF